MSQRALIVGLNAYKTMTPLRSCLNDVLQVESYLVGSAGFTLRDITVLTDEDATRASILEALSEMLSPATPAERLVFYFTGHGLQIEDTQGDEADGLDEALVTAAADRTELLTDDELYPLLTSPPPGAALYAIIDACHSGVDDVMPAADVKGGDRGGYVIVASALPEQSSWQMGSEASIRRHGYEWWEDGRYHGAFTYYMFKVLRMFPEGLSCRRLVEKVNLYLQLHDYEQRGVVEGTPALIERPLLKPW